MSGVQSPDLLLEPPPIKDVDGFSGRIKESALRKISSFSESMSDRTLDCCRYHEATFEFVGCERCPNGTFSVTGEELECIACPPGTIGRDGTCAACPPGAFSRNPGSTQCGLCPAGSAQPAEGAAQCEACARGFFSAAPGAAQCEPCSQDSYNPSPNQTQCQHCPPNTAAAFFAATDEGMCRCVEGFYPTSGDGQQW